MKATVIDVDLVDGGVVINFGSGEAAVFSPDFLYANRNSERNRVIPDEYEATEDLESPSEE